MGDFVLILDEPEYATTEDLDEIVEAILESLERTAGKQSELTE